MGKVSKRFKVFTNIYKDVDKDTRTALTREDMNIFKEQVENDLDNFILCKTSSLKGVVLLKDVKTENWNLFHNMYFAARPEKNDDLIVRSKKAREASEDPALPVIGTSGGAMDLQSIMSSPIFSSMISTVLPVVQKAFEGKDMKNLDINEVMNGLITKDPSKCGGIDIDALLTESVAKLKQNL